MEPFLDELSQQEAWQELAGVLRRVLAGERDPHTLLAGQDAASTVIASDVLHALGVELDEGRAISLDELFNLVFQACQPEASAGPREQLFAAIRAMSTDPEMPVDQRALGRVLNQILVGERDLDLSGLPAELAAQVRALLAALKSSAPPGVE